MCIFNLIGYYQIFLLFMLLSAMNETVVTASCSHQRLLLLDLNFVANLKVMQGYLTVILFRISLITSEIEHFVLCLLTIWFCTSAELSDQ